MSRQRLYLHGQHGRQIADDRLPAVSGVGGGVYLSPGGAEVDPAGVEGVDGHRVAEHVDVAVLLREALGERLPLAPAGTAAVDAQPALRREMVRVAGDR